MNRNKIMSGINMALIVASVSFLGARFNQAKAQDQPPPSGCESYIDMTSSCPAGSMVFYTNRRLICKTSGNWCCEYYKTDKYCYPPGGGSSLAGYFANYQNAYVTPLTCGGTTSGQCS